MFKRIAVSVFFPVFTLALLFYLKDFFQETDRYAFDSIVGDIMNVLYLWPLMLLKGIGLLGSFPAGIHNTWAYESILCSLAIQVGLLFSAYKPEEEET